MYAFLNTSMVFSSLVDGAVPAVVSDRIASFGTCAGDTVSDHSYGC